MSFRLSMEARQYFGRMDDYSQTGKLRSTWDWYYLCFMVGAAKARRSQPTGATEFVDHFIADYQPQKDEIISILIAAELQRQVIDPSVETEVSQVMNELLDPDGPTSLSPEGHTAMNEYAEAGFETLSEDIEDPTEVAGFLQSYVALYCMG